MRTLLAAALAVLPLAAAAQMAHDGHAMAPAAGAAEPARDIATINSDMHAAMAVEPSGDPDVDFVRAMIPHHEGAVAMAELVLEEGTDPDVKALAEEVIAAQEAEITWMREWLAARGLD